MKLCGLAGTAFDFGAIEGVFPGFPAERYCIVLFFSDILYTLTAVK